MEETISLQELLSIIKKRVGLLIVSLFVGLGVAGFVTYFLLEPLYSSRTQLIVRLPQSETNNVNEINGNLQMINTYKDLIESDTVTKVVQQRMNDLYDNDFSTDQLKQSISVTQSQNSQMFSIQAKADTPNIAQNIANLTAQTFQEKAKDTLNIDKISIISDATASSKPVSPNTKLNLVLGMIVGLVGGVFLAFLLEVFDKTIKDSRFVDEELGLATLGIVPNMTAKELNAKITRPAVSSMSDSQYLKSDSAQGEKTRGSIAETRKSRSRV